MLLYVIIPSALVGALSSFFLRARSLTEPLSLQNWKTQWLTPVPKVLCFHAICTMADEHQGSVEQKAEMLSGWLSVSE